MMRKFCCVVMLLCCLSTEAQPLATRLVATSPRLSYDDTRTLAVDVQSLAFFQNDEYGGEQMTGYTLPGVRLEPRLTYQPLDAVRLEAGFSALFFNGANKYPCFAYHDIARWKAGQYQRGAHLLPFFRAEAQLKKLHFVLGNLYGGSSHGLPEVLYSPENDLSQDPEAGFQLLLDMPRYHLDAWINWQSFIFRQDTHQEAFTVGIHQKINLNSFPPSYGEGSGVGLYVPVDILIQHRGGEIDATDMGVQTIDNGSVGLGMRWSSRSRALNAVVAEVRALGAWQQTGALWPFDVGGGASFSASAELWRQARVFADVVYAKDFCPLYGSPYFSTVSQKHGGSFRYALTPHIGAEWHHTFARDYVLGARIETFIPHTGEMKKADGTVSPSATTNNFAFGIYMRCSPRAVIFRSKR